MARRDRDADDDDDLVEISPLVSKGPLPWGRLIAGLTCFVFGGVLLYSSAEIIFLAPQNLSRPLRVLHILILLGSPLLAAYGGHLSVRFWQTVRGRVVSTAEVDDEAAVEPNVDFACMECGCEMELPVRAIKRVVKCPECKSPIRADECLEIARNRGKKPTAPEGIVLTSLVCMGVGFAMITMPCLYIAAPLVSLVGAIFSSYALHRYRGSGLLWTCCVGAWLAFMAGSKNVEETFRMIRDQERRDRMIFDRRP